MHYRVFGVNVEGTGQEMESEGQIVRAHLGREGEREGEREKGREKGREKEKGKRGEGERDDEREGEIR